jgi:hypothetical protein
MNLPRRHHTNPRFYLDRWSGRDKQICAMRLIRGVIKPRRFHPQNTGWVLDLYRTFGVPEADSQKLEVEFMGPLDGNASLAMTKLVARTDLDQDERRRGPNFFSRCSTGTRKRSPTSSRTWPR